jgi:hypothetical protein
LQQLPQRRHIPHPQLHFNLAPHYSLRRPLRRSASPKNFSM